MSVDLVGDGIHSCRDNGLTCGSSCVFKCCFCSRISAPEMKIEAPIYKFPFAGTALLYLRFFPFFFAFILGAAAAAVCSAIWCLCLRRLASGSAPAPCPAISHRPQKLFAKVPHISQDQTLGLARSP